jgi:hypothetical protein
LTLLFTDIVDSTKLKQGLGDREAVPVIQRHHTVIREILGQFSEGEEIETAGDSFFIVSTKPSGLYFVSLLENTPTLQSSATSAPCFKAVLLTPPQ